MSAFPAEVKMPRQISFIARSPPAMLDFSVTGAISVQQLLNWDRNVKPCKALKPDVVRALSLSLFLSLYIPTHLFFKPNMIQVWFVYESNIIWIDGNFTCLQWFGLQERGKISRKHKYDIWFFEYIMKIMKDHEAYHTQVTQIPYTSH